ncbi:MAG: hypothetical protein ACI81Q_001930, partial [Paracoccaceae bacterium]
HRSSQLYLVPTPMMGRDVSGGAIWTAKHLVLSLKGG